MEIREALSYDDVLLVPQRSTVNSRQEVDLTSKLSTNITLKLPFVTAPMDTVCEYQMAITMAQLGAFGIIHRGLSLEKQVEQVERVKRSENIVIEKPYAVKPFDTLKQAKLVMTEKNVTGLVVTENTGTLTGLLTHRDLLFQENDEVLVKDVMNKSFISAKPGLQLEEYIQIMKENKVEKLPLVAEGKLAGLVTAKDILKKREHPNATRDKKGRLQCGAAIGMRSELKERLKALYEAEVDLILVDIAHGHLQKYLDVVTQIKKDYGDAFDLMGGNVATRKGAEDLARAKVDAIRCGVGPGAACVTRVVTGCGVPQLTAVIDCVSGAEGIPVNADGGIKEPGDAMKALAAGASTVMCGQLFAGTTESPGRVIFKNGKRYKEYRGQASYAALKDLGLEDKRSPEGVEATVPFKGPVKDILDYYLGGIRSGFSYCNAHTIEELWQNAQFVKMTAAGMRESKPHDINVT